MSAPSGDDAEAGPGVGPDATLELRAAMALCSWQSWDLWVATMPIGGQFTHDDVKHIVSGKRPPTRAEYSVLAATLNEQCHDLGQDHPVPMRLDRKA